MFGERIREVEIVSTEVNDTDIDKTPLSKKVCFYDKKRASYDTLETGMRKSEKYK